MAWSTKWSGPRVGEGGCGVGAWPTWSGDTELRPVVEARCRGVEDSRMLAYELHAEVESRIACESSAEKASNIRRACDQVCHGG